MKGRSLNQVSVHFNIEQHLVLKQEASLHFFTGLLIWALKVERSSSKMPKYSQCVKSLTRLSCRVFHDRRRIDWLLELENCVILVCEPFKSSTSTAEVKPAVIVNERSLTFNHWRKENKLDIYKLAREVCLCADARRHINICSMSARILYKNKSENCMKTNKANKHPTKCVIFFLDRNSQGCNDSDSDTNSVFVWHPWAENIQKSMGSMNNPAYVHGHTPEVRGRRPSATRQEDACPVSLPDSFISLRRQGRWEICQQVSAGGVQGDARGSTL